MAKAGGHVIESRFNAVLRRPNAFQMLEHEVCRFVGHAASNSRFFSARADGLTMAELAQRFNCSSGAIEKHLAKLRASDPQFPDNPLGYLMKPPGLG
jgi:hypothetical protein